MGVKSAVLGVAKRAGVLAWTRDSAWRSSRLLILCYHGVSMRDEHEWNPELYVTAQHLRQRFAWLRAQRYSILPLGNAIDRLQSGSLPPRAIAVTFDDGATDFLERAVPVLREFDVPSTVYLTTYYCDVRYPVFDTALSYLLWKAVGQREVAVDVAGTPVTLRLTDEAAAASSALMVRELVNRHGVSADQKQHLLQRVAAQAGLDFQEFLDSGMLRIMSPAEVAQLPRDLVDVQLHTHRHRTPRDHQAFLREIVENRERIADLTAAESATIRHFCYPSGDYSRAFAPWLREAGVRSATTCVPGMARPGDDLLLLPRLIDTMRTSDLTFEAWTTGFAELLPRKQAYRLDRDRE